MSKKKPEGETAPVDEPTEKRKRRAGEFIVLKTAETGPDFSQVAEGASVKACVAAITEGKLIGKFVIVSVRRRVTAEVQETVKLT